MAFIGKLNRVRVVRETPQGFYVDGEALGEILLPGRYRTPETVPGADVEVFVYRDSEDRLVATTERPVALAGEFGFMRVVSVNPRLGAFLDWGLDKDLFLPIRECPRTRLRPGDWLVVRVLIDERSNRIVASARLPRYLNLTVPDYEEGEAVDLIIESEADLGYNAIVNHAHRGLLYRSDLAEPVRVGQRVAGFVLRVRDDGKIDLTIHRAGYRRIRPLGEQILDQLEAAGGRMPYHDGSTPAEIQAAFGVSKKAFKQAIGALFRERHIVIEKDGIRRVDGSR